MDKEIKISEEQKERLEEIRKEFQKYKEKEDYKERLKQIENINNVKKFLIKNNILKKLENKKAFQNLMKIFVGGISLEKKKEYFNFFDINNENIDILYSNLNKNNLNNKFLFGYSHLNSQNFIYYDNKKANDLITKFIYNIYNKNYSKVIENLIEIEKNKLPKFTPISISNFMVSINNKEFYLLSNPIIESLKKFFKLNIENNFSNYISNIKILKEFIKKLNIENFAILDGFLYYLNDIQTTKTIPHKKPQIIENENNMDKIDEGKIKENFTNNILKKKKQIILYGPPGTGKTYNTKNIIYNFLNNENDLLKNNDKSNIKNKYDELEKEGRVKFITFHQSFAYEEFIEGLKPKLDEENSNEIEYEISKGIFKEICETIILNYTSNLKEFYKLTKEERNDLLENSKPYFLIIDEINRGNISKIFGELITLLEKDKRLDGENELIANLPYSKEKFGIPPNLYIIATMNTSDKSIATLDIALRRRFGFIEMLPIDNLDEINKNCEGINLQNLLNRLNKRIEYLLDKDHTIGHSYFMEINTIKKLKEVFYNEIIPLLEEYFYGNYDKLRLVIGDLFFIKNIKNDLNYIKEIFGKEITDLVDDEPIFKLKDKKEIEFKEAINDLLKQNNQNSTESENK